MQSSKRHEHVGMTQVKRAIAFEQQTPTKQHKRRNGNGRKGSYLPQNEQLEILTRRMNGESVRRIAADLGREWNTVDRVIKSDEMQAEIEKAKGAVLGMWREWYGSIRRCVNTEMDGEMAWRLLLAFGIIPTAPQKVEATRPMTEADTQSQIEFYRNRALMQIAAVTLERSRVYGIDPPMEREELEKMMPKEVVDKLIGAPRPPVEEEPDALVVPESAHVFKHE